MRDIVVNKIRRRQQVAVAELVAVLTTKKEEQLVSVFEKGHFGRYSCLT